MKKILAVLIMVACAVVGLQGVPEAHADSFCDGISDADLKEAAGCNTGTTADSAAGSMINWVIGIVGVVAVGAMIYGGFTLIVSNGDPNRAARSRAILIYGAVGLAIVILAYFIVGFVVKSV